MKRKKKRNRKPMTLDQLEIKGRRDLFKMKWLELRKTYIAQYQNAVSKNHDASMTHSIACYLTLCKHEITSMKGYRIDYEACFESYLIEVSTLYGMPTLTPGEMELHAATITFLIESKRAINDALKRWREAQEKRIPQ